MCRCRKHFFVVGLGAMMTGIWCQWAVLTFAGLLLAAFCLMFVDEGLGLEKNEERTRFSL